MADDIEKTRHQKQQIQDELKSPAVSRRGFIDRIKALGFGFGAAVALGVEGAEARDVPETSVKSHLDQSGGGGNPQRRWRAG